MSDEQKPAATPPRPAPDEPIAAGETILLIDPKGREYLRDLRPGRRFSLHCGVIDADAIIGRPDGSRIASSLGQTCIAFRPPYARLIPNLPRQAQVVYPKDAASIVVWGDVYPGARVVESGVGPGALTMALLRAIGPAGHLTSVERREYQGDFKGFGILRSARGPRLVDGSTMSSRMARINRGMCRGFSWSISSVMA